MDKIGKQKVRKKFIFFVKVHTSFWENFDKKTMKKTSDHQHWQCLVKMANGSKNHLQKCFQFGAFVHFRNFAALLNILLSLKAVIYNIHFFKTYLQNL